MPVLQHSRCFYTLRPQVVDCKEERCPTDTSQHPGQLGLAQGLDVVLDAAEELSNLPDAQFVLVGDGTDADRLRRVAGERGLNNIRFLGRQPAARMPHIFAISDVLLVHLRDEPLFRITIPSKTMAYMACGRPVLMACKPSSLQGTSAWPRG